MAIGRPKAENLSRFNIDTGLTSSRKFLRLKRELNLSESETLHILVKIWWFTADNYAFWPTIEQKDFDIVADFCNWNSEINEPKTLFDALKKAEFLENDFTIHDWFKNQPLADKLVYDRVEYAVKHDFKIAIHPQWIALHKGIELSIKDFPHEKEDFPHEKSPKSLRKVTINRSKGKESKGNESVCDDQHTDPENESVLWNKLADQFQFVEPVDKLTPARKEKLATRRLEKEFDWALIVESIRKLCVSKRFPSKSGWTPQFSWVIKSQSNYISIIEQGKATVNGNDNPFGIDRSQYDYNIFDEERDESK